MSDTRIPAGQPDPISMLQWYLEAGVDEAIGESAPNRLTAQPAPPRAVMPPQTRTPSTFPGNPRPSTAGSGAPRTATPKTGDAPIGDVTAAHLAMACSNLAELKAAMETYDGCALKRTCQRTVFADGNPEAKIMLVGEAPGADEDREGRPFVGVSGQLLDRMLQSIGLDRTSAYIANVVPWRPPGNRKPEPAEVALCLPFIVRHIELVDPAVLVILGGAAAAALLARPESITRLRGRWHEFASSGLPRPIAAMPTFHPAYLLRTPLQKREAWRDFRAIRKRLAQ